MGHLFPLALVGLTDLYLLPDRPGVAYDTIESLKWLMLATLRGADPEPVIEVLYSGGKQLTVAQFQEATRRAEAYADQHWQTVDLLMRPLPSK